MEKIKDRGFIMIYCKLKENYPILSEDLKKDCIDYALSCLENKNSMEAWYCRVEKENKNSLGYIEENNIIEKSGGVGFYFLDSELNQRVIDDFKKSGNQEINFTLYAVQAVVGGDFVGPHVDDPSARKEGVLYMLKTGGENVLTRWYNIKEQYRHLDIPTGTGIPYERLNIADEHCLKEDKWYWLNFNQIHSVENQQSVRLALYGTYL